MNESAVKQRKEKYQIDGVSITDDDIRNQFKDPSISSETIIEDLHHMCDMGKHLCKYLTKHYHKILDDLHLCLQKDGISEEMQKHIIDRELYVAKCIDRINQASYCALILFVVICFCCLRSLIYKRPK